MRTAVLRLGLAASWFCCPGAMASVEVTYELGGFTLGLEAYADASGTEVQDADHLYARYFNGFVGSRPHGSASVPGAEIVGQGEYVYEGLTWTGPVAHLRASGFLEASATVTDPAAVAWAWAIPPNLYQVVTFATTEHYAFEFSKAVDTVNEASSGRFFFNVGGYYGIEAVTGTEGVLPPDTYTVGFEADFELATGGIGLFDARTEWSWELELTPLTAIGDQGDRDAGVVPEPDPRIAWGLGLLTLAVARARKQVRLAGRLPSRPSRPQPGLSNGAT